MQDKKLSYKKVLCWLLLAVGIIGYLVALFFLCYAAYFWIDGSFIHKNAAEDQSGGLDGLGFILEFGAAVIVGGIASIFFVPGMLLWSKIYKQNALG